mgnify:CR=1 FL=1
MNCLSMAILPFECQRCDTNFVFKHLKERESMSFGKWLGSIFGSGAKGAATGAMGGPWGALAGLGAGALAGAGASALSKSPRMQNVSRLTPQQQAWQSQLGQQGMQQLQNPFEGFQPIEQRARDQFQQTTVPSLAERFTAMGNGQRSSAFQGALGQAGSGLESNLAAMRSQYGMQNRQQGAGFLSQAMQPSFDTVQQQKSPGFLESSLGALSGGLGQYGAQQLLFGDPQQNQAAGSFGGQQQGGNLPPQIMQLLSSPKFLAFLQQQGAM